MGPPVVTFFITESLDMPLVACDNACGIERGVAAFVSGVKMALFFTVGSFHSFT